MYMFVSYSISVIVELYTCLCVHVYMYVYMDKFDTRILAKSSYLIIFHGNSWIEYLKSLHYVVNTAGSLPISPLLSWNGHISAAVGLADNTQHCTFILRNYLGRVKPPKPIRNISQFCILMSMHKTKDWQIHGSRNLATFLQGWTTLYCHSHSLLGQAEARDQLKSNLYLDFFSFLILLYLNILLTEFHHCIICTITLLLIFVSGEHEPGNKIKLPLCAMRFQPKWNVLRSQCLHNLV